MACPGLLSRVPILHRLPRVQDESMQAGGEVPKQGLLSISLLPF